VVVLSIYGGVDGRQAGGGDSWQMGWRGEKGRANKMVETEEKGLVFSIFAPDFLHIQAMKSTPIYREWKMAILFSLVKTFSP